MAPALNSRPCSRPIISHSFPGSFAGTLTSRRLLRLRLQPRTFSSLSLRSENVPSRPSVSSTSPRLVSSVGFSSSPSPILRCNFTHRHILILNVIACAAAVSATWLFCSAIPTLLAFKTAAESLEKLLDTTREELPDTMAAIRLSGMEISDLTMELSDLGQEISQGVRRSTRAVHVTEKNLRRFTNTAASGGGSSQARSSGAGACQIPEGCPRGYR